MIEPEGVAGCDKGGISHPNGTTYDAQFFL